jgi:hypothetical protein
MLRTILALIMLSACVSSSSSSGRQEILGLEEMSLEYIQMQWGNPDYKLPRRTGQTVKFEKILTRDQDPVTGHVTEQLCTIRLDIDREGLVEQWDYETCVELNPQRPSPQAVGISDDEDFNIDDREAPELIDLE